MYIQDQSKDNKKLGNTLRCKIALIDEFIRPECGIQKKVQVVLSFEESHGFTGKKKVI